MTAATKPGNDAVLKQLERIVNSPDFDSSSRAREFLRYEVAALVAGRETQIPQHAIAQTVFGRGIDFDPTTDPIVRMRAGRVRRALAHLDRRGEVAAAASQILRLKRDFRDRSRWLICRCVKFDDLVQCIEDGLAKAGLQMKPS